MAGKKQVQFYVLELTEFNLIAKLPYRISPNEEKLGESICNENISDFKKQNLCKINKSIVKPPK